MALEGDQWITERALVTLLTPLAKRHAKGGEQHVVDGAMIDGGCAQQTLRVGLTELSTHMRGAAQGVLTGLDDAVAGQVLRTLEL